jgi:hypothetical protein
MGSAVPNTSSESVIPHLLDLIGFSWVFLDLNFEWAGNQPANLLPARRSRSNPPWRLFN